jgi:hypothetical protein
MTSARPLHELLADLVGDADAGRAHGDPEAYLAAHGHPGLPADLVAEAVVSYADTAPVEVAEHLAPFVTAHSAIPVEPDADAETNWFDLLTSAPPSADDPELDELPGDEPWSATEDPGPGLDFGSGAADLDLPSTPDSSATGEDGQDDLDEPAEQSGWAGIEPENTALDAVPTATEDDDAEDETDEDAGGLD